MFISFLSPFFSSLTLSFLASTYNITKAQANRNVAVFSGTISAYIGIVSVSLSSFTNNSVSRSGGVFFGERYSEVTLNAVNLTSNNGGFYGGGVGVESDAVAFLTGCHFLANTAAEGGAVYIGVHAAINVTGTTFASNTGMPEEDRQDSEDVSINLVTDFFLFPAQRGGAIFAEKAQPSNIQSSEFIDNSVSNDGACSCYFWRSFPFAPPPHSFSFDWLQASGVLIQYLL